MTAPTITYPRVPLKDMDCAMLVFELSRESDRVFGHGDASEQITSAMQVATHLHRDQRRLVRGDMPRVPYIEHPLRNALRLIRWGLGCADGVTVALLHDTVEDCSDEIERDFATADQSASDWITQGYGEAVGTRVVALTNPQGPYAEHILAMAADGDLITLLNKASDLVDNAGSLKHQHGHVPDRFITGRLVKYVHAVYHVSAALRLDGDPVALAAAADLRTVQDDLHELAKVLGLDI